MVDNKRAILICCIIVIMYSTAYLIYQRNAVFSLFLNEEVKEVQIEKEIPMVTITAGSLIFSSIATGVYIKKGLKKHKEDEETQNADKYSTNFVLTQEKNALRGRKIITQ